MRIWVDADACPVVIKEFLYRTAARAQLSLVLVANKMLRVPPSPWIKARQVPGGFDVADERIALEVHAGDLVITADVPLAAQVIAKGATVIDPRGELLATPNIKERLTMRNFMCIASPASGGRDRRVGGFFQFGSAGVRKTVLQAIGEAAAGSIHAFLSP